MIGEMILQRHALPEGAAARFDAFHRLLCEANEHMDLTNVTAEDEALEKHYLDSLTALEYLPQGAKCVDVGTGAGFPGVPLLLARPDLAMTLLDAQQKRILFLRETLAQIGAQAECVHARVEDFARERRESYDAAVSRAVAPLNILLEWLLPLVRVGGRCILWKGPAAQSELDDANRISALLGGGALDVREAAVTEGSGHVLILVEKIAPADKKFPRKAGMAKKRPL